MGNVNEWPLRVAQENRLEDPERSLWLRLFSNDRSSQAHQLLTRNLPFDARHRFINLLAHPGPGHATEALGLIEDLLTDDMLIQITAAQAAARLGSAVPVPALRVLNQLADAEFPAARAEIAIAWGTLLAVTPQRAQFGLAGIARHPEVNVRETAARTIAYIPPSFFPKIRQLITELALDPFAAVRREALLSLKPHMAMWSAEAGALVIPSAKDGRWGLREAAALVLGSAQGPAVRSFTNVLLSLCMDPVVAVSVQASKSLADLARREPAQLHATLTRMAKDCGYIAAEALKELIAVLRDLGPRTPDRAIAILSHLGKDADAEIRSRSSQAIDELDRLRYRRA